MRRKAIPLHKKRHAHFVEAILEHDNPHKSIASHLGVGTGARPDTICHTHSSWFFYDDDGRLYYQIPSSDPCRKYGHTDPCCDCKNNNHTEYEPKTPSGSGRQILISNTWTSPLTGEKEYFGLKDAVESYFALDGPRAPDGAQHGHEMIRGKGVSKGPYSQWIREIAAESDMIAEFRERRLRQELHMGDEDRDQPLIKDFGTDENGNGIPDLFAHDLRGTFCTQLMRNEVPPTKAINKTGHYDPDSMHPYVMFAANEINAEDEDTWY